MKTMLISLVVVGLSAVFLFMSSRGSAAAQGAAVVIRKAMTPDERVRMFIADFHRTHDKHPMKTTDFETWQAAMSVLDGAHFSGGAGMALAGSMSSTSDHDPAIEKIVGTTIRDGVTFVETEAPDISLRAWNEYELHQIDGDWRIAAIVRFLTPEGKPLVDEKDHARLVSTKSVPLRAIPSVERFNGISLMKSGKKVRLDGQNKESEVQVREVGRLNVRTGTLVVADFGYGARLFVPLSIRVPPGQYVVRVATAFGRNAALEVRFSEGLVHDWHPADATTGGHVVGVDAGDIAVFDVAAVLNITDRNHQRLFNRYGSAMSAKEPTAILMTATDKDDVAIADSGFGDGQYPVYWGLDAKQRPVVLLVDFFLSELVGRE